MKLVAGPFAPFASDVTCVEDRGDEVLVRFTVFGDSSVRPMPRDHTDLPPLPAPVVPPIEEVLDALIDWMRADAPNCLDAMPATTEEDLALLRELDTGLPGAPLDDLAALYRRIGGTSEWLGFWQGLSLLPPAGARSHAELMRELVADGTFDRWMPGEWWHHAWIPFLDNHSYDTVCIDLEGVYEGVPGQVIEWHKDAPESTILAPSLAAWLHFWVEAGRQGMLEWNAEEGGLMEVPGADVKRERLHRRLLPGYPRIVTARTQLDVLGTAPPPKPTSELAETAPGLEYAVVGAWWAPRQEGVFALSWLADRALLAIGQYGSDAVPGLSLVDPASGAVVEVVVAGDDGAACEIAAVPGGFVYRRLADSTNRIHVWVDGDRPIREDLPTRMEPMMSVGGDLVAVAAEQVEIWLLIAGAPRVLPIDGDHAVVALSPDGGTLAVGPRESVVSWYDATNGHQLGASRGPMSPNALAFGLVGDLWALGWAGTTVRLDLATGDTREHDGMPDLSVVAVHPAGWVALAGYNGWVQILDARTGGQVAADRSHEGAVHALVFDSAGERLWSACMGGKVVERRIRWAPQGSGAGRPPTI